MTDERRKIQERRERERRRSTSNHDDADDGELATRARRVLDRARDGDHVPVPRTRRRPQASDAPSGVLRSDLSLPSQSRRPGTATSPPPSILITADLSVVVAAAALIAIGYAWFHSVTAARFEEVEEQGLVVAVPKGWLRNPLHSHGSFLAPRYRPATRPSVDKNAVRIQYVSPASNRESIEITVEPRPSLSNIQAYLDLRRVSRYGNLVQAETEASRSIMGRDWSRTRFHYARSRTREGGFEFGAGREFHAADHDQLYVLTLHASPESIEQLSEQISPSLRVRNKSLSRESR